MGKTKCCKKSSSTKCDDSCSSSSYGHCCPKYPKCYCVRDKCSPIYYPNNTIGQYPCNPCRPPQCPPYNPCNPCPPYNPCNPCPPFNPCPPTQCGAKYTSYNTINSSDLILSASSSNVYICNPPISGLTITLPAISSLGSCCYTKMFVISNISNIFGTTGSVIISVTAGDTLTNPSATPIATNTTVTLYSVNISGGAGYWVVA